MVKVAVIVLNWNRHRETIECLKSIRELRIVNCELWVYVVDNGSTDGCVDKIKNTNEKLNIQIIQNKQNLGYAGGNNVGIRQALKDGADFVVVLNNDTIVDKNLIIEFLKEAQENPDAGIFSPKIYFAKGFEFHKNRYSKKDLGRVIWAAGGDLDWNNVYGANHGVDEVDSGQFEKEREIDFATGACMFVRREVFEKVGFFNEDYFLYFEDVEFCERVKRRSFKILYAPNSFLWHKVAQSSGIGSGLNDYFTTRNRLLFGLKYAGLRAKLALVRESLGLLAAGRYWQKRGVVDFYLGRWGKGSWR